MILVYGYLDDPPIARLVGALQDAGATYVLVEMRALDREHLRIDVGSDGVEGCLVSAGQAIALADVHSVYARPLELPPHWSAPHSAPRLLHEQLCEWLDVTPALVVSRPRAMQPNASKPLQAQLIGAAGFRVPATLVTNDAAEAREFWRRHGRVIFKSVSGVRSIVEELDERHARRLERLEALPTQFQAYVPGVDVRVHVVGREAFAAEIRSPVSDYRYAGRTGAAVDLAPMALPPEIAARCIGMAEAMELPLAGIDLRLRPDGELVCFEVNPMPAYTYYEGQTGMPISATLATLLIRGKRAFTENDHGAGN